MGKAEHWKWLNQYEKNHIYNPYIQKIQMLAKKGKTANIAGNWERASEIYMECSQIAAKANLWEHELIYAYLSNELATLFLTKTGQLDIALEIVIKAQKLDVENFPWYPLFQFHLAIMYTNLDALSYSKEILEIYDIVENYAHHRLDLMCRIQIARANVAVYLFEFEKSQHYAKLAAEVNPDDNYYHTFACKINALVHYRQAKFLFALQWFKAMEHHAKAANELPNRIIDSIFQQGVCLLYLNREDEAEERFAHCKNLEDVYQLKIPEWTEYSRYIASQEYDIVLDAMNKNLSKEIVNRYSNFTCILGKTIMLNLMGEPIDEMLESARRDAQNFKKPEAYNLWIDAVANGDTLFYNWHKVDHSAES